jgi:hypothetical protein
MCIQIYKTIIITFWFVLCETCSLALMEEHIVGIWEHGADENIWP